MKNERSFLKCEICGNMVGVIENSGVHIICCGQEMTALTPNTVDASREKHVPVTSLDGNKLTVTIGAEPHPMTEAHHISWISVAQDSLTQRHTLKPTDVASCEFIIHNGPATVYAYCNLHGLWAIELP